MNLSNTLEQRRNILLLLVMAIGCGLRLLHLYLSADNPFYHAPALDEKYYVESAIALVKGFDGGAGHYMDPLLVTVLRGVFSVSESLFSARILMLLLDTLNIFLVYHLARCWLAAGPALLASVLYAAYKPAIFYASLLLKPVLAVTMCLLFVLVLTRALRSDNKNWWLCTGLVATLAIYTRGNLIFLVLLAPFVVWLEKRSAPKILVPLSLATVTMVLSALLLNPLLLDQDARGSFFGSGAGYAFYSSNHAENLAGDHQPPSFVLTNHPREIDFYYRAEASRRLGKTLDTASASIYWREQAMATMVAEPVKTLKRFGRRLLYLFSGYERPNNYSLDQNAAFSSLLAIPLPGFALALALGIPGLILLVARDRSAAALWIPIATVFATGFLFFVASRLRLPAVPFLLIGAAAMLAYLQQLWLQKKYRRVGVFLGTITLLASMATLLPEFRQPDAGRSYNLAVAYLHLGQIEPATDLVQKLVKENPANSKYYLLLGNLVLAQKKLTNAIHLFEIALAIDPNNVDALYNLGIAWLELGRTEEAENAIHQALERKPDPAYRLGLGRVMAFRGEFESAAEQWRLVADNPGVDLATRTRARDFLDSIE